MTAKSIDNLHVALDLAEGSPGKTSLLLLQNNANTNTNTTRF